MQEDILVSVIIPVFHDWKRLSRCIEAINKQSLNRHKYEIIVVNNDPSENSPNTIDASVILVDEKKPGSYAARNKGLMEAKGKLLAFTDSDCIPDKRWLENGIQHFFNNRDCSLLGGEVKIQCGSAKLNLYQKHDLIFAFRQEEYIKNGFSVTANLFVKKEVFSSIGLFNDELKSGGDYEFCTRALNNGFKLCYGKDVVISHPARNSLKELKQKAKRIAGGIAWKGTYTKSMVLAILHLRPPIKDLYRLLKSKHVKCWDKFKIFLLKYYLRVIATIERVRVLNGKISNRY